MAETNEVTLTDEQVNQLQAFGVTSSNPGDITPFFYDSGAGFSLAEPPGAKVEPLLTPEQIGPAIAPIMAWLLPTLGVRGELVQLVLAVLRGEQPVGIISDWLQDWGREDDAAAVRESNKVTQ